MPYMTQNKKHKQTLEGAQYGLEVSFKFGLNVIDVGMLLKSAVKYTFQKSLSSRRFLTTENLSTLIQTTLYVAVQVYYVRLHISLVN